MANKTEDEEKRDGDQREPFLAAKIDKIVPLIEHDGKVHKLEEFISTKAGDLSAVYQQIQKDFHGNLKAVKLCRQLSTMTTDKAFDFMRTFMPLAKALGLIPSEDLVDLMGGVEEPDFSTRGDKERGQSVADVAPKADKRVVPITTGKNAIDRAKEALASGNKPPAPKGPPGDTDFVEHADAVVADRLKEQEAIDAQRKTDGAEFDKMETQATVN